MANQLLQLPPHYFLFLVLFFSVVHHSNQLEPFQSQSLVSILRFLDYPLSFNTTSNLCNVEPTSSLTVICYENNISQLHIIGNNGFPQLPKNFEVNSFFATLVTLSHLKVLSLVSLGFWGPLPASIGEFSSVEILNISSNHFYGAIPQQVSSLKSLQTLVLDHNKFTGQVPSWLSSLPVLAVLSLKNNSFTGSLPNTISSLENLRILSLSNNNLSGEIPDLHSLTNLQVVDLQDNYFGPHFPRLHTKLVTIMLRNNSFQFGLPSFLVTFYQLQKLDISMNGFVGPFWPSLLSLPSIIYIDISENKFTGLLYENMSCSSNLGHVNLSSNFLTGDLPTCLKSSSKMMVMEYSSNCLSSEEQKQHPPSFCHNEALAVKPHEKLKRNTGTHHKAVLQSCTAVGSIGAIVIVCLVLMAIKKVTTKFLVKKHKTRVVMEKVPSVNTVKLISDARYISQTMKLGASFPPYRTFSVEELKEATNNFDDSHLLGDASHSKIYGGKLADETVVAIRSLTVKKKHSHSQQSIVQHIELMSKLRHSHLVSALGHCFDCSSDDSTISRIFVIFEYVPHGTLRDHTSGTQRKKLNWKQRIGAGVGVAKGIQFLHTGVVPGVYSNNIKITDVLLDHDLQVKIRRYNLPLLSESKERVCSAVGSQLPNQSIWTRERDDDKKDVYDLGVILVELIVGRPIMSLEEVNVVKDLLQVSKTVDDTARRSIVDPAVRKECSDDALKTMMEISIRCLSDQLSDRPSVEDVLWNLQFAAQLQESWQGSGHHNINQESDTSCCQV